MYNRHCVTDVHLPCVHDSRFYKLLQSCEALMAIVMLRKNVGGA
jgi:hypothetical protein